MTRVGPESDPECTRWVKDAVRARHSTDGLNGGPGPWTVLEEYLSIDMLAFAAWSSATPRTTGIKYPVVGYEVKVSRADYRREILKPSKRRQAIAATNQFYFAVPKGLLKKEELAWVQPEHHEDGSAYQRDPCPGRCQRMRRRDLEFHNRHVTFTGKTGRWVDVPCALGDARCRATQVRGYGQKGPWRSYDPGQPFADYEHRMPRMLQVWEVCRECEGKGYLARSVVEEEAPTLWIPNDMGLIEVSAKGVCRSVRKAPVRETTPLWDSHPLGLVIRHASYRPDPRHARS